MYTNKITYPPLQGNGWKLNNSELSIDWDSDENVTQIQQAVALIKKGCGCKTGCSSSRCKCKKGVNFCLGCKCINCNNQTHTTTQYATHTATEPCVPASTMSESSSDSEVESDLDLEKEVDGMMVEIFGDTQTDVDTDTECTAMSMDT